MTSPAIQDGRTDFDFFMGRWRVHHRRLRHRLAGDTHRAGGTQWAGNMQWEEFGGTCETRPILGGLGNMDDNLLELPAGTYQAATIRRFDPALRRWSIWWTDGRSPGIEPPVHGAFVDGVGTFFGEDQLDGRPILVRFVWSGITANSARWEQAFSPDAGASWEINWVMSFERIG